MIISSRLSPERTEDDNHNLNLEKLQSGILQGLFLRPDSEIIPKITCSYV
jgi:hypothetical protein